MRFRDSVPPVSYTHLAVGDVEDAVLQAHDAAGRDLELEVGLGLSLIHILPASASVYLIGANWAAALPVVIASELSLIHI